MVVLHPRVPYTLRLPRPQRQRQWECNDSSAGSDIDSGGSSIGNHGGNSNRTSSSSCSSMSKGSISDRIPRLHEPHAAGRLRARGSHSTNSTSVSYITSIHYRSGRTSDDDASNTDAKSVTDGLRGSR